MAKELENLTPEQIAKTDAIVEKWSRRALNNPSVNREKAVELINFLYKRTGLNEPKIVFSGSPQGNQDALKAEMEKLGLKYSYVAPYELLNYCSTLAFFDYFDELGLVEKQEDALTYKELVFQSGLWEVIAMDTTAFVCGCPSTVIRNEKNQLHYDNGPALAWPDGHKLFFLFGVEFTEEEYWKVVRGKLTLADVQGYKNADQRAAATAFLPAKDLLEHVGGVLIHTGIEGTRLYKVDNFENLGETHYAIVMNCPSTGREFLEWVLPEVGALGDADAAQASCWTDEEGNPISVEDWLVADHA